MIQLYTQCLKSIMVLACLLTSVAVSGQHVNSSQRPTHSSCATHPQKSIDVYEYDCVDTPPQFPGGEVAMMRFIKSERRYPEQAYKDGIEGRVRCSFVVNKDGRISHINVLRGVEHSIDREAVRIISEMPAWRAGEINSNPVPVYCILSIPFRI